jgi:hypothetical protein
MTPLEANNAREEALMVRPKCVETKANFFDNVGKVLDLTRKGKVHTK